MEDVLLNIVQEASGHKQITLRKAAQDAHDMLCRQHGASRDPSYELRASCLNALQLALESKRSKAVSLALNGLHRIIRDERFHAGLEPENDSLWLPSQILRATASVAPNRSIPSSNGVGNKYSSAQDALVNVLRVLLAMACSPSACPLNGRIVIELLARCGECWETGCRAVRAAAQAAAGQTLRAFCGFLDEEWRELDRVREHSRASRSSAEECKAKLANLPPTGGETFYNNVQNDGVAWTPSSAVAVYSESIPVMQFLISRLEESNMPPKPCESRLYVLECLLSLLTALPPVVRGNAHFTTFLWQKFCPALVAFLGTPRVDKHFVSRDYAQTLESGRGSGVLGSAPTLTGGGARCVYLVVGQLVRLVGGEGSLRPVLEALFHRALLYPPPRCRAEALRWVRDLFREPSRLLDMAVLTHHRGQQACGDDMAILRLIMDSLEECALCGEEAVLTPGVACIVTLLGSLQKLTQGQGVSAEAAVSVNRKYPTLEDSDYRGPLVYQSLARLPAPYRDVVAGLRCETGTESDSDCDGDSGNPDEERSDTSGDTEGPEDEAQSDAEVRNGGIRPPWETFGVSNNIRPSLGRGDADLDRGNARQFAKRMRDELVPKLLRLRTSIEVDEALQDFASRCCRSAGPPSCIDQPIMNADGVYLATYSALLLGLRLLRAGHYAQTDAQSPPVPLTESQFVEEVQNSGVLVYLSGAWLCELYQQVIAQSPLPIIPLTSGHCALVDLLTDLGGLGSSQMLSEWQKLQAVSEVRPDPTPEAQAGCKLARRILTCCWDSLVSVLSRALGAQVKGSHSNTARLKKLIRNGAKKKRAEASLISASLEGLHKVATLSNTLALQRLSSSILTLLCNNVCGEKITTLSTDHALSLDVLLTGGLELGSHNALCWPAVLTACRHVCRLEHAIFTGPAPPVPLQQNNAADRNVSMAYHAGEEDETCVDVYSFLSTGCSTNAGYTRVPLSGALGPDGTGCCGSCPEAPLRPHEAARALCSLSQQVDALFHDAALKLTLPALIDFLRSLCHASREQLFSRVNDSSSNSKSAVSLPPALRWLARDRSSCGPSRPEPPTLLLHRVGAVTLKIVRGSRPLLHTMRVWAVVGPHLMEASCHKDRSISSRAVTYIHDCVTALLSEQTELPHFHFNEALLKPFENLLSLELCDSDVQDQIVSCLCETVEAHSCEIQSGWRPLFGTLRGANGTAQHLHNVSDIFRVFLNTDNALVFANAALDCILCLLTHVRCTDISSMEELEESKTHIGAEALKYLETCAGILANMYNMTKCPVFNSAHRIQEENIPQTVDPTIPSIVQNTPYFETAPEESEQSYRLLSTSEVSMSIADMDNSSGILRVWFLMLEGLASATIICPKSLQPDALETLFKLLRDLMDTPGPQFGLYCINHLLLPMMQNWLRQTSRVHRGWDNVAVNFKQCCGMASDLIVEYLHRLQDTGDEHIEVDSAANRLKCTVIRRPVDNLKFGQIRRHETPAERENNQVFINTPATHGYEKPINLALKQLLLVLTECTTQSHESIARLGVSCIRHVLLASGVFLTPAQWEISCVALHRACDVTLGPLRQLSMAFHEHSDSFYGDTAIVKVAARKDCTLEDNIRLNAVARQVLLLDGQRDCKAASSDWNANSFLDDRSYVFLLYPVDLATTLNPELYTLRVSYRNFIVSLLAHQMLQQAIASIILHGNTNMPILDNVLVENCVGNLMDCYKDKLNQKHMELLLKCLSLSYKRSQDFDSKPGLKFLLQKVSNIEHSANLYKQSNAAWIVKMVTLVELCVSGIAKYNLCVSDIKYIIESCNTENSQKLKYECFIRYLMDLKDTWNSYCDLYASKQHKLNADNFSIASDVSVTNENLENIELEDDVFIEESQCEDKSPTKSSSCSDIKRQQSLQSDMSSDYGDEVSVTENVLYGKPVSKISSKEIIAEYNLVDQRNSTEIGSQSMLDAEVQKRVDNMMEQYKQKQSIGQSPSCHSSVRVNPFNERLGVIAPLPVPPEIEQQRVHSMEKDAEAQRSAQSQSIRAVLELLLSLPSAPLSCLRFVLATGAQSLARSSSEPTIINLAHALWQTEES